MPSEQGSKLALTVWLEHADMREAVSAPVPDHYLRLSNALETHRIRLP